MSGDEQLDQEVQEVGASDEKASPSELPLLINLLGWYGTIAIVSAYAALSLEWLERGVLYHLLNLTGALGVGLVCLRRKAWQPFWLEVVWTLVAVAGLVVVLT